MGMKKKNKAYLAFTLVFWSIIITGVTLFGVSFRKVRVNNYGILRNYYNSWMDENIYNSGLYHVGVGNYFVEFPSSHVYVEDVKLNITNRDMKVMQITYSLVYRIRKDQVKSLYFAYSTEYQDRIISTINSILSNHFISKSQQQSRTTLQSELITQITSTFVTPNSSILSKAIYLREFWFNEIDFLDKEPEYETAYMDSSSFSESYELMEIELMRANMQVETLQNLVEVQRANIMLTAQSSIQNETNRILQQAIYEEARQKIMLSFASNVSQIFEFYEPTKIVLV